MQFSPPEAHPIVMTDAGTGDAFVSIKMHTGTWYFVQSMQAVNQTRNGLKCIPMIYDIMGSTGANTRYPIGEMKIQENDLGVAWNLKQWLRGSEMGVYIDGTVVADALFGVIVYGEQI